MITFGCGATAVVGYEGGEYIIPAGTWQLPGATNVYVGTNAAVALELRSCAYVYVDPNGLVSVEDGPDYYGAWTIGFGIIFGALGALAAVRWVIARVFRGAGVVRDLE